MILSGKESFALVIKSMLKMFERLCEDLKDIFCKIFFGAISLLFTILWKDYEDLLDFKFGTLLWYPRRIHKYTNSLLTLKKVEIKFFRVMLLKYYF